MIFKIFLVTLFSFQAAPSFGAGAFNIKRLPLGKNVTLPRPALSIIPMDESTTLSSTDVPQTIIFSLARPTNANLKIAIHDPQSEHVQYLSISKKHRALYTFKGLSTIRIVPHSSRTTKGNQLMVESDKPLSIGR